MMGVMAGTASDELRALFVRANLGEPPIPDALKAQLVRNSEWSFSTPSAPTRNPYRYFDFERAAQPDDAPPFVLVGHGGHGVSSYAIGYYLVLRDGLRDPDDFARAVRKLVTSV